MESGTNIFMPDVYNIKNMNLIFILKKNNIHKLAQRTGYVDVEQMLCD